MPRVASDPSTLKFASLDKMGAGLTEAKLDGLKAIYAGTKDASGKLLNRGYPVGGEAGAAAWSLWSTGTGPGQTKGSLMNGFSSGYFANMVFDKADWAGRQRFRRWRKLVCFAEDGRGA